jgi:hypothetical protein
MHKAKFSITQPGVIGIFFGRTQRCWFGGHTKPVAPFRDIGDKEFQPEPACRRYPNDGTLPKAIFARKRLVFEYGPVSGQKQSFSAVF